MSEKNQNLLSSQNESQQSSTQIQDDKQKNDNQGSKAQKSLGKISLFYDQEDSFPHISINPPEQQFELSDSSYQQKEKFTNLNKYNIFEEYDNNDLVNEKKENQQMPNYLKKTIDGQKNIDELRNIICQIEQPIRFNLSANGLQRRKFSEERDYQFNFQSDLKSERQIITNKDSFNSHPKLQQNYCLKANENQDKEINHSIHQQQDYDNQISYKKPHGKSDQNDFQSFIFQAQQYPGKLSDRNFLKQFMLVLQAKCKHGSIVDNQEQAVFLVGIMQGKQVMGKRTREEVEEEEGKQIVIDVISSVKDIYQWNLFHYTCMYGLKNETQFLVEQLGLPINSLNSSNYSGLHIAAKNGHESIVKYLVEQAAPVKSNVLIKGLDGELASTSAYNMGHDTIGQYLQIKENQSQNWENRNCLLKIYAYQNADNKLLKGFSIDIFKEIIKYA